MTTPTIHKLLSTDHKDSVYFQAFSTHVEHWGPKIEGTAHDTVEQARATYRRYLDMGYKLQTPPTLRKLRRIKNR